MSNLIELENLKTGTTNWQISTTVTLAREIEGYANLCSVNRGGTLLIAVNTVGTKFKAETFRIGWYGGDGGRLVDTQTNFDGVVQTIPSPTDNIYNMVECAWAPQVTINVPSDATDWTSGIYLTKLTITSGTGVNKSSYVIFCVRDDDRHSRYLYQQPVTTYSAYNSWPGFVGVNGASLYTPEDLSDTRPRSVKVSFNRPYFMGDTAELHPEWRVGAGAGDFIVEEAANLRFHGVGGEINLVRFLEKEGYDVTYSTDIETHTTAGQLLIHDAILIPWHDEYTTTTMRTNLLAAIDAGVSVAFMCANTYYWHVRAENSANGRVFGQFIAYKELAPTGSASPGPDPIQTSETTDLWRSTKVGHPESGLLGVMYDNFIANENNLIVTNPAHPLFVGTGFTQDQVFTGCLNGEIDTTDSFSPVGIVTLCSSLGVSSGSSKMTIYQAGSGAWVFAAGMQAMMWMLDDYNSPTLRPSFLQTGWQQFTRNLLELMSPINGIMLLGEVTLSGSVVLS